MTVVHRSHTARDDLTSAMREVRSWSFGAPDRSIWLDNARSVSQCQVHQIDGSNAILHRLPGVNASAARLTAS